MPGPRDDKPTWLRYSGLGIELAGILAIFVFFGLWVDRHFDISPWGFLASFGLGLTGGLYKFIRTSLKATSAANKVVAEQSARRPVETRPARAESHSGREQSSK